MNIILVMIPLSLLILAGAVAMFFWAVNHDQFEDLDSPGLLPLADDPEEAAVAGGERQEPDATDL
ncbi:MAG TPA: cbb3-type cytochrome oxidase assembly protein CcoS [Alcanivorax sp.]|jgi:cbb3-type cytochrome oxidase maturation protein|nr:MAG: cbb3-type cytochrome oxidase assembly protein CcoS [Alcanivorax sp.]HEX5678372.1 cbb3-type cytochrome oxidase assembly protein CcoS [Alcanivorax sp.]